MVKIRTKLEHALREYIDSLRNQIEIEKVILFGSFAYGQVDSNSDIDIIVLSRDFKKLPFLKRLEFLSRARNGSARKVPMDIIGYTPEEFSRLSRRSVVLGEIKQKGKVVWG